MSDPATAVQKALRARLTATSAVVALVPEANILDRHERPAPDPSIIMGEDQIVDSGTLIDRSMYRVHSTLHIWKTEKSLEGVKAIAGIVWKAIKSQRLIAPAGFVFADCKVNDTRFLRDPDGTRSHGVVTIETIVREVAA